jgi:multiple sugar transport system substrate-binding protein
MYCHTGRKAQLTRRQVIAKATAYSSAALLPDLALAATDQGLHLDVAHKAKALAGHDARLTMLIPNGSGANVGPVIAIFKELSGVDVVSREVPVDEINTQLTLDGLGGEADYDLALPATFGIPDLVNNGTIRPLTEYAKQHEPTGFRDDILYSIGDTFDGEIYGFQTDGDAYVMFYNDLLLSDPDEQARYADRYGVELDVPRTWSELDRQMAFFHRPEKEQYGGALFRTPGYLAWEWWVRFHSYGVWPMSPDLEPQIASEAGVAALEDMIRSTEYLYPHARSAGLFENWVEYGKGNTYANIGWGGSQKYLNGPESKLRGNMRFGMTPCMEEGIALPYFNWGWNYVVSATSTQPELAYLFALFASTSDISTLSVQQQGGFFDPFRPEHYGDPVIQKIYSPEFLKVHEQSMKNSIPDLYLAQQGEYFRVLTEWLDAAMNGRAAPEEALKRVATTWSVLNLRAGHEEQKTRWNALRSKYPVAARNTLRDL